MHIYLFSKNLCYFSSCILQKTNHSFALLLHIDNIICELSHLKVKSSYNTYKMFIILSKLQAFSLPAFELWCLQLD